LLTGIVTAVAAISLIVGGIGIMNIMLVSVTERTREIGIRLAIGAVASEVLLQFLVEAVALSMLGGVIGLVIAQIAILSLTPLLKVEYLFVPEINLIAFGISAVIGVVFGYFPARRAAALNPIDALRHE
jgi:putative ABC transport system permease protein